MGVGVSVAEECGEEVDLRGRGFSSLESYAFAFETDARVLCYWIPHFCGMAVNASAGVLAFAIETDAGVLCYWVPHRCAG